MVYDKNGSSHSSTMPPFTPPGGVPAVPVKKTIVDRTLSYRFYPHFHPYVHELVHELIERSVRGLQDMDTEVDPHEALFTSTRYDPSELVLDTEDEPYPVKELDFGTGGAYSTYNWELFFHAPITIAIHLSRNQRFEEAQRWLHHVFDPTDASAGPTPQRFWKVKPFRTTDVKSIEQVLVNLATNADPGLRDDTINSIGAWQDAPFRPHLVARYRQSAYMVKAVMAYLDNLVDWGDSLFRQDTGESVNEATQLYVLAANILGPRPQAMPRRGWHRPQTYASLRADLDAFGNAMREVELDIPFDNAPHPQQKADDAALSTVDGLASLYFCVPRNDKLLGYWDTVADRLFKIRNSLNIQGVFRQLPLFEPPIDPALLAKAVTAGLDVGAVISGLNQPLPLVRFAFLIGKAQEICQEVTSLGSQLLSAIEKEDGEALAAIRARHDSVILRLAESVRYHQLQEARKATEGMAQTWRNAKERYRYYELLLGRDSEDIDAIVLELGALEFVGDGTAEPAVDGREIDVDISTDLADAEGRKISSHEAEELDKLGTAQLIQDGVVFADVNVAAMAAIPQFEAAAKPMGAGASVTMGGLHISKIAEAASALGRGFVAKLNHEANLAAKVGSYTRREQEWVHQSNLAAGELTLIYKQWRAAQIREASAGLEYENHRKQVEHADEIERFLTDPRSAKTTTQAFYVWLRREVRGLYSQYFQLAFDVARKAERALQHELGDHSQSFLRFDYQSGRQALLSGEKLSFDLKRMELAYHEQNRREYELTKHVSLRALGGDLLGLRATGSCVITLPEELFDFDGPGHYFRRIKSVGLSVPCVVGPYASVNCTLTLLKSTIRTSPVLGQEGYARAGEDPGRFSDHFGSVQSIVTSTGSNDSGMFEATLRDERYLPFEGAGAISQWRLELPAGLPQFDHDTISDVVLHLRYTAREGGAPLREKAVENLFARVKDGTAPGTVRLLSVRQEFPTAWAAFTAATLAGSPPKAPLELTLRAEHYPFWATKLSKTTLTRVSLFARPGAAGTLTVYQQQGDSAGVGLVAAGGFLVGDLPVSGTSVTGPLVPWFDDNTMPDLWVALTWSGEPPT